MSSERAIFLDVLTVPRVRDILAAWKASHPAMGILALVPEADRGNVDLIQAACREEGVPLAGAVFPALVLGSQFRPDGALLLRFDEMPFSELCPAGSTEEMVRKITNSVTDNLHDSRNTTLFLFFDALIPTVATILERLYLELADHVHYLGVNAGSETFKPIPCLFDNDHQIQGGVLLLLLRNHRGGILEHGYKAPPVMLTATSTDGNRIIEIDWSPAFDVYVKMMQHQYGVAITRENFYQYAVHFPFGIMRANGEILVRIPVALEEDGSLFCVGEVPPNAILTLLSAPDVDSVQTVNTLVEGLKAAYGDLSNQEIITFYCAGRRLHIGDQARQELHQLLIRSRAANLLGALSLGEIGSSVHGGYPLFHNGTLVCAPWTGR